MIFRALIFVACLAMAVPSVDAAEESLGNTLKKIFSTPTPTPHRKKKAASPEKKSSPAPSPSPKKRHSPVAEGSPSPTPSASPKKKRASAAKTESPSPTSSPSSHRKKKASPTPTPEETPPPSATPSASTHRKKKGSPTPAESESPSPSPSESPTAASSPQKKSHAENATLLPNQIKGFENYPLKVQKLLTAALDLTTRNLDYKYGSADPTSGGMDCSGFVYYVLKQNDVSDVPRDSAEQYVWLRRAHRFEAVMSEKDDSFELEDLKPGDLLFWTGTYSIQRDPPITHAMIYVGREKKTGNRVMVGASDG
ncbi:MAG TPA: NlpC/P60 family protein, partial [Chthoniobacterales bacterium]|nr:NlpC/P60 family protein [Chthoniobacterales bacterium]